MKRFHIYALFIALLSSNLTSAQKVSELSHRTVRVSTGDSLITASISLTSNPKHTNAKAIYYWYYNNSIKSNQGDYMGKLLDGTYKVIDKDKNLIEKGETKQGLKHGSWKNWDSKGQLQSTYLWKNGLRHGKYKICVDSGKIVTGKYKKGKRHGVYKKFQTGQLIERGKYKNGLLHGKVTQYRQDTTYAVLQYKHGKQQVDTIAKNEKSPPKESKDERAQPQPDKHVWWKFWKKKKQPESEPEEKNEKADKPRNKKKERKLKKAAKTQNND